MYLLVSLVDVIQLHPSEFNKSSARAIEDFVNAKYADKVIHRVGLCVGFHSIISMSEGLIGHGTGIVHVNVDFRVVVFRPFKGEILNATITQSTPRMGIALSHDFFEDVVVPPETLFEGTTWSRDDSGTELYIWEQEVEGESEPSRYYFDRAERCLYRVEEEQWHDLSPHKQKQSQTFGRAEPVSKGTSGRKPPYLIRGSMMLSGLGPTLWWSNEEQNEDMETMQDDDHGDTDRMEA